MKFPLNFHQSFAPEKEAIAQIVQFASNNFNDFYTKEEISQLTSIPTGKRSGKVVPHINYANAMGLICVKKDGATFKISLTPLGQVVSEEDPYFIEELTNYLCHCNLSSITSKAEMWSYIYNVVIKTYGLVLTNNSLKSTLNKYFDGKDVNITPFRTCYIEDRCFGDLKLLEILEEKYIFKSHKVNKSYKFLYGYLLLSNWEQLLPNQSEITHNNLINEIGFGNPFLWDEASINETLEILREERVIVINRQLSPVTYIKRISSKSLLSKIYSLLI
ncbi:DUF4007 family protein [Bacillus sp. DNRA2]|uniref:hypothetical protein n=1 Tax=Bacillus sp. DNRA2 TaxID=2723053 RepID=UPI00145DADAE|nr:hypothetical protein [Bacillus sp. DNRA2]NMD72295.1 DUF4007 family protein [Bacillus sp. DNRA2]